jgi:hypothetical protein
MERNSSGALRAPARAWRLRRRRAANGTSDPHWHAIVSSCSLHITRVCSAGLRVLRLNFNLGRSTEGRRSTADDAASGRASAPGAAATILSTGMRVCRRSAAIHAAHLLAPSWPAVLRLQIRGTLDGPKCRTFSAHRSNLKLTLS